MKKNKVWYVLVGLFCLCTSSATVYATSYKTESPVGVRFYDATSTSSTSSSTSSSTTNSTTSSTTSASSSSSTSSSSGTVPSASSLPDTNEKKSGFLWWGNGDGGSGGTTRYYADNKLLPSTGELVHLALPFAGVFLVMLVFFYLKRSWREEHE